MTAISAETAPRTTEPRRRPRHNRIELRLTMRPVMRLTDEEVEACERLTLGERGMMLRTLRRARRHSRGERALLAHDSAGRLVGWALLRPGWDAGQYTAYVFVDERLRRRGVGRAIMARIRRAGVRVRVCPWDETSRMFFSRYVSTGRASCVSGYSL
jgi:GNAT superfamily N-acetyltransferase